MPQTRAVAVQMCDENLLEITQKGQAVDPHSFKGPIRLRLPVQQGSESEQPDSKTQKT